jgi:hypothetical protein
MRGRYWTSPVALAGVLALMPLAVVSAQSPATASKAGSSKSKSERATSAAASKATAAKTGIPRTPWGDPNLQGTWFVLYDEPLERPDKYAGREFLTDAEVQASDAKKGLDPGRNARSSDKLQDVSGAYNAVFNSVLRTGKRTSMIIDPPDGRIPPRVPGAAPVRGFFGGGGRGRGGAGGRGQAGRGGRGNLAIYGVAPGENDNPETVAQSPRCFGVQMPFLPLNTLFAQGTVMQVVQSPKSIGIYMEDDHAGGGNRVIYMDGRPHAPANLKFYLGDSRGHWEGNTLVIETTNYEQGFQGANPDTYKTIERLTLVDANNLNREVTFIDPKTWTRPWTVEIQMGKARDDKHMIFDSACHEGNYGLTGVLVGARREEQKAAAEKK